MSTMRRPGILHPGRKRAPVRRLLTEEQRKEVLDAFELFDIVRSASAATLPGGQQGAIFEHSLGSKRRCHLRGTLRR